MEVLFVFNCKKYAIVFLNTYLQTCQNFAAWIHRSGITEWKDVHIKQIQGNIKLPSEKTEPIYNSICVRVFISIHW